MTQTQAQAAPVVELIRSALSGDPAAWPAYADWLEETGAPEWAAWVRKRARVLWANAGAKNLEDVIRQEDALGARCLWERHDPAPVESLPGRNGYGLFAGPEVWRLIPLAARYFRPAETDEAGWGWWTSGMDAVDALIAQGFDHDDPPRPGGEEAYRQALYMALEAMYLDPETEIEWEES